jgi:hypothetical protein
MKMKCCEYGHKTVMLDSSCFIINLTRINRFERQLICPSFLPLCRAPFLDSAGGGNGTAHFGLWNLHLWPVLKMFYNRK